MITNEEKLKIELLRQKYLHHANRQRNFRKYEPERFNEFEFAKSIGSIKAIECVMQILGYKKSDIEGENENENEFEQ